MSKRKALLSLIDKLAAEAKAAKPIVKKGLERSDLLKESQLAEGQKVAQKLTSGEEFAKRFGLKKAAGLAGAITASSLMSKEEAEAAGLTTIAKKLGVSLQEAKQIKDFAKIARSTDEFEDKINAIRTVRKYVDVPNQYKQIGAGQDQKVFNVDGQALKVPYRDFSTNMDAISPALTEQIGLGAKTITVRSPERQYQVQELLQDYKASNELRNSEEFKQVLEEGADAIADNDTEAYLNANRKLIEMKLADLEKRGFDSPSFKEAVEKASGGNEEYAQNLLDNPAYVFSKKLSKEAKLGPLSKKITPEDIHEGNIAFDPITSESKIIDTSRFHDLVPENLTPEDRKFVLSRFAGSPEEKAKLTQMLEEGIPSPQKPMAPDTPAWLKKGAAAAAGAALVGAPTEEAEAGVLSGLSRLELDKVISNIMKMPGGPTYENIFKVVDTISGGNPYKARAIIDNMYGHQLMNQFNIREMKNPVDQILEAQNALHPVPESQIGFWQEGLPEDLERVNKLKYGITRKNELPPGVGGYNVSKSRGLLDEGDLLYNLRMMSGKENLPAFAPDDMTQMVGHENKHFVESFNPDLPSSVPVNHYAFQRGVPSKQVLEDYAKGHFGEYPTTYAEAEDLAKLLQGTYINPQRSIPVGKNNIEDLLSQQIQNSKKAKLMLLDEEEKRIRNFLETDDDNLLRFAASQNYLYDPNLPRDVNINKIVNSLESNLRAIQKAKANISNRPSTMDRLAETRKATPDIPEDRFMGSQLKKVAGIAPIATFEPKEFITDPLKDVANMYQKYVNKPIREAADYIGEEVGDALDLSKYATIPQQREALRQAAETGKTGLKLGAEIALDPSNLLSPGAGIIVPTAAELFADEDEE